MARLLVVLGSLLLLATAALHAAGVEMVEGWAAGLGERQATALKLVWLSDSFDWAVAAAIWLAAAWKPAWTAAALVAGLIPLAGGIGVVALDPTFFGGHMLLASVALAGAGLLAMRRRRGAEAPA